MTERANIVEATEGERTPVVGEWYFEVPEDEALIASPLRRAVRPLELAISVLASSGILIPRWILFRRWIELVNGTFRNAGLPSITVAIEHSTDALWIESQARTLASDLDHDEAIPEILVRGMTEVILPGVGAERRPDLFELRSVYDGVGVTIILLTFTDIWTIFGPLAVRPDEDSHENALRLRRVLRRLSMALHAPVQPGDPTAYATPRETGLGPPLR
jgi:hypothetical protein